MSIAVIIVAAGRGLRMGGGQAKQWRLLAGRPVVDRTLDAFRAALPDARLAIALPPGELVRAEAFPGVLAVEGGADRATSVRNALEALAPEAPDLVLIHDAARPLVPAATIRAVVDALADHPAAAPGLAVTDALWRTRDGMVEGPVDREGLARAQTPQGFHFARILAAHRAHIGGAADDVAVALAAGLPVRAVPGDTRNIKLTLPGDFDRAEALLRTTMDIRCGNGFDVHAFGPGDHVWLCGVRVPHHMGLVGHSDADVGLHALTDAIYGALAEGDIGRHFPPSDPQWKGAESHIFLRHAGTLAATRGYRITNVDVTLICERPKVGPHAAAMMAVVAEVLGIGTDRVSVKATTSERLGFTGREEGIAAIATATMVSG